jgi:hypothetical protein
MHTCICLLYLIGLKHLEQCEFLVQILACNPKCKRVLDCIFLYSFQFSERHMCFPGKSVYSAFKGDPSVITSCSVLLLLSFADRFSFLLIRTVSVFLFHRLQKLPLIAFISSAELSSGKHLSAIPT